MGVMHCQRHGPHVNVHIDNDGAYGIFTINETLKRLDCEPEPRLLYLKAQYHAYTSFVLPDMLTDRTGTEEALHFLSSGICQPWSPLSIAQNRSLIYLARLTPRREYYPRHLKAMQKTSWDFNLTTNIQHDRFRAFVDAIQERSEELTIFSRQDSQISPLDRGGEHHLITRSQLRRQRYQRTSAGFWTQTAKESITILPYPARHYPKNNQMRKSVLEVTLLVRSWPSRLGTTESLGSLLHGQPVIRGFGQKYDSMLLSDLLDLDLPSHWGPLINFCRRRQFEDRYELMFLFAVMAFTHTKPEELALMRTLLSFAINDELKKLEKPIWPSYSNFQYSEIPLLDTFFPLILPFLVPYPGDDRLLFLDFEFGLSAKQRLQLEKQEREYVQQQTNDGKTFTNFLLKQWPCQQPNLKGLPKSLLIDASAALNAVLPEWFRLYQNSQLSTFLGDTQKILSAHACESQAPSPAMEIREQKVWPARVRGGELPQLSDLLRKTFNDTPKLSNQSRYNDQANSISKSDVTGSMFSAASAAIPDETPEIAQIQQMVDRLVASNLSVHQQYGQDLGQSLDALRRLKVDSTSRQSKIQQATRLLSQIRPAHQEEERRLRDLRSTFERGNISDRAVEWLQHGGLWPCITPVTLLESLRSTTRIVFGKGMKECLVNYALSITSLQRLLRMESAHLKGNQQRLVEEYQNAGHSNWQPLQQTDWLLLEVDDNFLIRPGQVEVALPTIFPSSKSNSVLQMVSKIYFLQETACNAMTCHRS